MAARVSLNGLNSEECSRILSVIARDRNLRKREQQRLSKIETELKEEAATRNVLIKHKAFNAKYCILCCSTFNFIFNKKLICRICTLNVCRNCALNEGKAWLCRVCEKQRSLYLQSCQWLCGDQTQRIKHFGSAKSFKFIKNNLSKSPSTPERLESGYDSVNESLVASELEATMNDDPHLKALYAEKCSPTTDRLSDSEEDKVLVEVRESIESLIEGFLSSSLDGAHVNRPYSHPKYDELFSKYHRKLSAGILSLTESLYLSLQNKPCIGNNTPTNAHIALKELIVHLTDCTSQLPQLPLREADNEDEMSIDDFQTYEQLLATAVINQLVTGNQSRYQLNDVSEGHQMITKTESHQVEVGAPFNLTDTGSVITAVAPVVIGEETKEGAGESDDEPLLVAGPSTTIFEEKIEEITTTKAYSDTPEDGADNRDSFSSGSYFFDFNCTQPTFRVPFPELGLDVVDMNYSSMYSEEFTRREGIKFTDLISWEENWLFQKKKKKSGHFVPQYAFNELALAESPVRMLIPNPSQEVDPQIGLRGIDEVSDLSERNSVGSLDISDEEVEELGETEEEGVEEKRRLEAERSREVEAVGRALGESRLDTKRLEKRNHVPKRPSHFLLKSEISLTPLIVPRFVPIDERNQQEVDVDPHFAIKPGSGSVQSEILVQFCCRVRGTKPLEVAWFRRDHLLVEDHNHRLFSHGNEYVLEIKRTSVELSDSYSCVVYNHLGQEWADFSLQVKQSNPRDRSRPLFAKIPIQSISKKPMKPKEPSIHVVQRTWAERTAALRSHGSLLPTIISASQTKCEGNDVTPVNEVKPQSPAEFRGAISEREHKKWEQSPVSWPDNPYTSENVAKRKCRSKSTDSVDTSSSTNEEDKEEAPSYMSTSKDLNRYRRDYYVPSPNTRDEAMNCLEEQVYSSSKFFDVRSKAEGDLNTRPNQEFTDNFNCMVTSAEDTSLEAEPLPSVRDLVQKFSTTAPRPERAEVKLRRRSTFNCNGTGVKPRVVSSQPAFEVHSLTARSLKKEFREKTQQNLPRVLNRFGSASLADIDKLHESGSSSPTETTTTCSPTNDGYLTDESSYSGPRKLSNEGQVQVRPTRKVARSILKRASFWEKRCEQGLLSDSSVNDEFPVMDKISYD